MSGLEAWESQYADRAASRQRSQADTAKLIVTFATGIAATLVATALQVAPKSDAWCAWSAVLLGVAAALALLTVGADRLTEVDYDQIYERSNAESWTDDKLVSTLRDEHLVAVENDLGQIRIMRLLTYLQLICAFLASVLAIKAI